MGQGTSLIGTWLTRIATSWLVYRLTNSPLLLGLVAFAGQIPTLILAPFAGVFVDRWNRHRLLVVTQVLAMLQSLALAILTLFGVISVVQIILLSIIQGLINAFDMPGRQAFLVEMVENREDLPNAIALNSSMVNAARLLGPSIGGILIASVGEGYCFLIDGISYIAVVIALLLMHIKPRPAVGQRASHLRELWEGVEYAFGFAPIRAVLVLTSLISIMGMSYTVLMPIFATQVLHGGSRTQGFLMAASGVGALIGALYLASRRTVLGLGRIIAIASAFFGLSLVAFAFSRFLWLSLGMLLISGFAMITQSASSNTILQTIVEDDKRGRVMSFFSVAFLGMTPIGSLLSGVLADYIGPSYTVAITGSCCVLAGIFFAMQLPVIRTLIRPIYVEKGILPEVAAGIQSTNQLRIPSES
jgi:MFS family permease